jgi:hypothetical protein
LQHLSKALRTLSDHSERILTELKDPDSLPARVSELQMTLFTLNNANLARLAIEIQQIWVDGHPRNATPIREFANNLLLVARVRPQLGPVLVNLVSQITDSTFRAYLSSRSDPRPKRAGGGTTFSAPHRSIRD